MTMELLDTDFPFFQGWCPGHAREGMLYSWPIKIPFHIKNTESRTR